jgi:hypothetical protein
MVCLKNMFASFRCVSCVTEADFHGPLVCITWWGASKKMFDACWGSSLALGLFDMPKAIIVQSMLNHHHSPVVSYLPCSFKLKPSPPFTNLHHGRSSGPKNERASSTRPLAVPVMQERYAPACLEAGAV